MQKFAFLIHPRDTSDIARRFWFTKFLPSAFVEFIIARLSGRFGFTVCAKNIKFTRSGVEADGYIIAVLLNGRQMMSLPKEKTRKRILDAVFYAQDELKADVIGLGSLIASVTDGGAWLVQQPDVDVSITHGDTFTVAVAQQGIEKILEKYSFDTARNKIAVVGAYGIIGRELCVFLAKKGFRLIIVESIPEKVELIKKRIRNEKLDKAILTASVNVEDVSAADLVITATSHPSYLLQSNHLKKNAIIYDIAQPINLPPSVVRHRPDITRIDGDYVDIGDIDLKFPMGPPERSAFACFVETAMMALEGDRRHHVGGICQSFIEETKNWGKKYNFSHASFTSFGKIIDFSRFNRD